MYTFELTIRREYKGDFPVVVRYQAGPSALTIWESGVFDLDLKQLDTLLPSDKKYGELLGRNLFREEVREAFIRAISEAKTADELLRVLLIVEESELRSLHWEQLCAPFEGGRWDYLLLNQQTPFSLYLPSQIERHFPPIGRRDLRALILVAGPETLEGDYGLAPFDVPTTVTSIRTTLGNIPCEVLASQVKGAVGKPTLDTLHQCLIAKHYTLLHIVCHGAYDQARGEPILYFPKGEQCRPITGSELITCLSRLDQVHGLPYFTFLSTCESANPRAESGLGGLGQRLVRELGMPAVLAMTDRISIQTAQELAKAFYSWLSEHGEVDRALAEALGGLQRRYDVTVPALISRLGGRPLFSDALDRELTESEIRFGLEQASALLKQRAPILLTELNTQVKRIKRSLGSDPQALSPEALRERKTALAEVNRLCNQALDLSFNALALGQKPPDYDDRCPFRGLYPFRAQDREFFFGRDALIEKLIQRLNEHRFLAVLGPSGCGKSSLVLAGLVPASSFPMVYLSPGSEPLAQLEAALSQADPGDGQSYLVVVDQFEELFTLCKDENQRQAFIDRLLDLSQEYYLVMTMRADFWGECAAYPALKQAMLANQELLAPLNAGELRGAIERQADHVGLRFEDGLGEKILDDTQDEPGAMPLLQHALLLLWQRRHGRWLRWEQYKSFGGIKQAIAHTAEEVYNHLTNYERERVRDVFLRLTRLENIETEGELRDTRRRVELAELIPAGNDPADTVALVNRLADARLVVTSVNAVSQRREVEVAHEALIRHWPRLRTWLVEDRTELRLWEGIREAALEWEVGQRESHLLVHRGGRLEDAEALSRQSKFTLNELEQAYLQACIGLRERERREKEEQQQRELEAARKLAAEQKARADEHAASAARLRRRSLVITTIGIIATVLAVLAMTFFIQAQGNAERAKNNAATATANLATAEAVSTLAIANAEEAQQQAKVARARELAALASNQLDQSLDLSLLLSNEAYRLEDLSQTRQALYKAGMQDPLQPHFLSSQTSYAENVAWSPDGRLASGSWDGTIIIWDLESGQPGMTLEGHTTEVSVAWSRDGRLASCSDDGIVIVWDLESRRPEITLKEHSPPINVAWSPDGRLASGLIDGTVIVWDLESGKPEMILEGHTGPVSSVAWSPDGRLASGSEDGTVFLWDLENRKPEMILEGHSNWVQSVAWSQDGRLASGSEDGTVIIWNLESSQPEMTLKRHNDVVSSVTWSPDGQLASGSFDGNVILWDMKSGQPEITLEGNSLPVYSVAWSQEGLLASCSKGGGVDLWIWEGFQPEIILEGPGYFTSMAWSRDGRLASGSWDGTVAVWDTESSQPKLTLNGHTGNVVSLAWSPFGQLASSSEDGTTILWNMETGQPEMFLEGYSFFVKSLAWSRDGRLASSSPGEVIVWDLESGQPEIILKGHMGEVSCVSWSRDGRLASSSYDSIIVWDLENNQPEMTLEGHDSIHSVAWLQEELLASVSVHGAIVLWDLENGQPETILEGRYGLPNDWSLENTFTFVNGTALSQDERLAFKLTTGTIIIIGLDSGLSEIAMEKYASGFSEVAWSQDGRLAFGVGENTIQIWQMNPERWIDQACQRAGRNLTRNEWAQYFPGEDYRKTCEQYPLETPELTPTPTP